ncbi:MAG: fused MFS/spermidine synthase [Proteobacteria bacterium]|nr:fused MFS/spermidine synthase [Pseudomonadota bacterium]
MIFGQIADKTKRVFLLLVITQLCASVMALIVSQVLGNSQFLFAKLIHTFNSSYSTMIIVQSVVIFVILIGPTIFMGGAFPIVNRIYIRSMNDLGKSLGTAYALNTVGAILGSIAAGYLMIPLIGKENGLRIVIMFQFVTAVLALLTTSTSGLKLTKRAVAGIGLVVSCIFLIFYFPSWHGDLLSRGWYRDFRTIEHELDRTGWMEALWKGCGLLSKQREGIDVVFYGEGIGGFTTVEKEITSIGTVEYAMFNSGKADASSHGDRSTQTLSAHIPMLFHSNAKNVMVLGLASGMTSGEVLLYPVEKLDIVEINEQVVKACRLYFTEWNNDCLSDPRTRLIIQDGRNHLALTREKYDVIISEPSNPWMAGLASLYTAEFFQMVRNRLNEKGIFAQWIQSYEMDWDTFCLLGRTFAKAFPNAALIKIGPADYMLLGFMDEKGFDWPVAQKNLRYAGKSGYVTFPGLKFLVHLILTEDLQALFGPGSVHADNRPILEFSAPLKLYSGSLNIDKAVAGKRRLSSDTLRMLETNSDYDTMLDLNEFFVSANVPAFDMVKWQNLNLEQKGRYKNAVLRYCSLVQVPSYNRFDNTDLKRNCAKLQIDRIRQRSSANGLRTVDHYNLGLALIAAGKEDEAVNEFRTTISLDPWHEKGHTALGLLLAKCGKLDEAALCFIRILEMSPKMAQAYKYLGMIDLRRGDLKSAVSSLSKAVALQPDDPEILTELGFVHFYRHNYKKAVESFSQVLAQKPMDADAHHNIALAYKHLGDPQKAGEHFLAAAQIDSEKNTLVENQNERTRNYRQ